MGPLGADDIPGGEAGRDLYAVEPSHFVSARDGLVKRLRADGRRDEAALVAKLRRPPATAWALNRVARTQPDLVEAVLDAGAGLRAATEAALGGDASGLRAAQARERRAADVVAGAGIAHLVAAGRIAGDDARRRMMATLRAAAVDPDAAARLVAGVLDDDREAPGFAVGAVDGGRRPAAGGEAAVVVDGPLAAADEAVGVAGAARAAIDDAARRLAEARGAAEAAATRLAEARARSDAARASAAAAEALARRLWAVADEADKRAARASEALDAAQAEAAHAAGAADPALPE